MVKFNIKRTATALAVAAAGVSAAAAFAGPATAAPAAQSPHSSEIGVLAYSSGPYDTFRECYRNQIEAENAGATITMGCSNLGGSYYFAYVY
ncbi:hypothetical protein [Salininema proteolyticum]|uniref:Uncharacterized protein n=1 Tax=Salininema proteolyticum TaxID=1607685 RepID=A0ABV8TVZ6_9ACTN